MTNLSPAAQAVLNAANGACCYGPDDILNDSRDIAATALRTAVNEVTPEKTIEDIDYVHQSYVDGYKDALYEILIIANELDL
jgi:hypothetical protein